MQGLLCIHPGNPFVCLFQVVGGSICDSVAFLFVCSKVEKISIFNKGLVAQVKRPVLHGQDVL